MSRRFLLLLLLVLACGGLRPAFGQQAAPSAVRVADLVPVDDIARNSVSNLHAEGDTLWVGPLLNLTADGGASWQVSDADSLRGSANRVFSIDVEGDVVVVGLGTTLDGEASAAGFLFSDDGGRTFAYRLPQLDARGDTLATYDGRTLPALDVIALQQSPPFDVDYDPVRGTIWTAGWASGIRRSDDQGRTWQRVVLPPDTRRTLAPGDPLNFRLAPYRGPGNGNLNHMGFAVLVDEAGTIWAGTPKGVNRSTDGGTSWERTGAGGTSGSLVGSWVVSIEEQPLPGRNAVWMATRNAAEAGDTYRDGVTVTRDGGETFEQVLVGVETIDFAFRGNTAFVAGRNDGLYVTDDGGRTWRSVTAFDVQGASGRFVRQGVDVLSVAVTADGALWVGTDDGLLRTTDASVGPGSAWTLFRAEVPLHPQTPSGSVPDVDTYAYPNPFSPVADGAVRIRYEGTGAARVRLFDFGMNLVRELRADCPGAEACEIAWDGTDAGGLRVANGVYFYTLSVDGQTVRGKIQVLE